MRVKTGMQKREGIAPVPSVCRRGWGARQGNKLDRMSPEGPCVLGVYNPMILQICWEDLRAKCPTA